MLAVYLVLYPAVVSLGVHVICGVVLFTPSVVHDASVSKEFTTDKRKIESVAAPTVPENNTFTAYYGYDGYDTTRISSNPTPFLEKRGIKRMLYGYTLGKEKQGDFAMKVLFRQDNYTELPVEEDFSRTTLAQDIEKTRYDLEIAYAGFDNATEPDMIDCYIYQVNSLLKRYTYLTSLAEKERAEVPELCPKSPIRTLISHVFG